MNQHRTAARLFAGLAIVSSLVVGGSTSAQAYDTGWNGTRIVKADFDTGWNGTKTVKTDFDTGWNGTR